MDHQVMRLLCCLALAGFLVAGCRMSDEGLPTTAGIETTDDDAGGNREADDAGGIAERPPGADSRPRDGATRDAAPAQIPDGAPTVVTTTDAAAPDRAVSSADAPVTVDAVVIHPDSPPVTLDAPAEVSHPTVGFVQCGNASCDLEATFCCATKTALGCRPDDDDCKGGAPRLCDGPEDCGGAKICCTQSDPAGGYRSSCMKAGECATGAATCHTANDCATRLCCPVTVGGLMTVGICEPGPGCR